MARLDFAVSTVYRRQSSVINSVVVYQMEFSIVYDNNHQDGVIEVGKFYYYMLTRHVRS